MDLKELTNLYVLLSKYKKEIVKCKLKRGGSRCQECIYRAFPHGGCQILIHLRNIQELRLEKIKKKS